MMKRCLALLSLSFLLLGNRCPREATILTISNEHIEDIYIFNRQNINFYPKEQLQQLILNAEFPKHKIAGKSCLVLGHPTEPSDINLNYFSVTDQNLYTVYFVNIKKDGTKLKRATYDSINISIDSIKEGSKNNLIIYRDKAIEFKNIKTNCGQITN